MIVGQNKKVDADNAKIEIQKHGHTRTDCPSGRKGKEQTNENASND